MPVIPPSEYKTVYHRKKYVDTVTGAMKKHVEKHEKCRSIQEHSWRQHQLTIPSHVDIIFLWRQLRGEGDFVHILQDIAEQYPLL